MRPQVNSVGVDNINIVNFEIYPNPVKSELNVICESEIQAIQIFDMFGRKCRTESNIIKSIDVANLKRGTYLISILTSEGISSKIFVKE